MAQHSGFGGIMWGGSACGGIVLQSVITTVPEKLPQTWSSPTVKNPQTWHYDDPEKQPEQWDETEKITPSDWVETGKQSEVWNENDDESTKKQPETWHYEQCIDGAGDGE